MASSGNFFEYVGAKLGVDVGFGKCILVYKEKKTINFADLDSVVLNDMISMGEIIGVIRGWHTITGASVAEINVERPATGEMKLIRDEIAADVLTFEANLQNRAVIADLVKAGSLNCILIDDHGNVFGENVATDGQISTMLLNFTTKATSSFQSDKATDKTIAVTVRYLVDNVDFLAAGVETELIGGKDKAEIKLTALTYKLTEVDAVFTMKSKLTGEVLTGLTGIATSVVTAIVNGHAADVDLQYNSASGECTLTLTPLVTGTFLVGSGHVALTISGAEFYVEETILPSETI